MPFQYLSEEEQYWHLQIASALLHSWPFLIFNCRKLCGVNYMRFAIQRANGNSVYISQRFYQWKIVCRNLFESPELSSLRIFCPIPRMWEFQKTYIYIYILGHRTSTQKQEKLQAKVRKGDMVPNFVFFLNQPRYICSHIYVGSIWTCSNKNQYHAVC